MEKRRKEGRRETCMRLTEEEGVTIRERDRLRWAEREYINYWVKRKLSKKENCPTKKYTLLYLFFNKNRLFSHTIYPNHSFLSSHSSQPSPPLLFLRSIPPVSSSQRKVQETKWKKTGNSNTRQSPLIEAGQGKPIRGKESQGQAKELEIYLS